MRRVTPIVIGLVLMTLVFAAGCGGAKETTGDGTSPPPIDTAARSVAASFSGDTLDGTSVSLESFKGKPLALIFWASW